MGGILTIARRNPCKYFAVPFTTTAAIEDFCLDSFFFSLSSLAEREDYL